MFVENPRSCSQNINPERGSAGNTTRSDFLYVFPEWFGYPEWLSGAVSVIYISRICFRLFPARRGEATGGRFALPELAFRSSLPAPGSYHSGSLRPRQSPRSRGRKESAVKPGSVVDSHSSGMRV